MLLAGLMSGTSLDAVDAAIVSIGAGPTDTADTACAVHAADTADTASAVDTADIADTVSTPDTASAAGATAAARTASVIGSSPIANRADTSEKATESGSAARLLAFCSVPMPSALRDALTALQSSGADELDRAALAANALADLYAEALQQAMRAAGVQPQALAAVGAHGQTVRHRPERGYTLQLLNAARLAERSGVAVVADLRGRDVAAGGQGAPLAPAFHAAAFAHPRQSRAIVNLGGIANVTWLAPAATRVLGFDTGPGNTLMDGWCARHRGEPFDRDGCWAATGRTDARLLDRLLDEPYFGRQPPKSTGRDLFNLQWVDALVDAHRAAVGAAPAPQDVQATLLELTARSVARACAALEPQAIYLCGGGARNARLGERLAELLRPVPVATTAALGLDPQAVEAVAFAWLAYRHLRGEAANLVAVTGASGPRVLGALYPA